MSFDLPPDLPDYERRLALRHPPHVQLHQDCRRDEPCWKAADRLDEDHHELPEPRYLSINVFDDIKMTEVVALEVSA